MNKIDFSQTGGFPLETETLDEMQKAYNLLQSLGDIVGEKSIIKGCAKIGTTVADGVIYVNGELLEFKGGQEQTTIVIIETAVTAEFEDGNVNPVYYTRYATFGSGLNSITWADFVRAFPLTSALFVDEVRMYAGDVTNIPWGWYLADGTNGTTNMTDVFPTQYIPADPVYGVMGAEVGANQINLQIGQLPKHKATGTTAAGGGHNHKLKDGTGGDKTNSITSGGGNLSGQDNPTNWVDDDTIIEPVPNHTHTFTSNEIGNDEPIDIRPKRRVIGYIQFKGV
jgi:hypothetical protein